MKFPCEIIAEPYITQLRIEAANFLHRQNLSQSQIANLMQISQPVVSGYLKKKSIPENVPDAIILKAREVGKQIGQMLLQDGEEIIPQAIGRACIECKILRQAGPTCIFHRQIIPQLDQDCDKCLTPQNLIELQVDKESALRTLRTTVTNLIRQPNIAHIIPEIGLQVVYGVQNVDSISDIVAFPGRINKRKNRPPLFGAPSFGGSETTSHLLMELRKYNLSITTIATLKSSKWLINRLLECDVEIKSVDGFDLDYVAGLQKIDELNSSAIVIVDMGSPGFEAISYFCCESLDSLETYLLKILN
jgi:predicted fused transcriptional regulator/phosphomethylpyrimidine kinase/predicted transcriptional regulator